MKTYTIKYTYEKWYSINVAAESEEQARELFFSGEFNNEDRVLIGEEIQDGIDIEEIDERTDDEKESK